jgi:O-antigen ligase
VRGFIDGFRDDWRGQWVSLLCAVAILFAFSQAWQAPLFGYTNDQASEGALIRYFYYPFYLCGLGLAVIARRRLLDAVWRTPLILGLLGLALTSVLWSIDPSGTLRRFIALSMTMLCGYTLAARFDWKRLTEVIAIAFGLMMALCYILAIVFPHLGRMSELFPGAWRGAWLEKNALGSVMALGFIAAASASLHNPARRWFWAAVAAGMLGLVLFSTSKTSLVALMIGAAAMAFVVLIRRGPVLGVVLTWLAVTVVLALGAFALIAPDKLFLLLGKDPTLTGRTFIWDGIRHAMRGHETWGFGYGVVWTDEDPYAPLARIKQVAGFRPYHAHSCWFELWLGLGVVGLYLWATVFAETWLKGLWRTFKGEGGYFALPLLGIFSLSSLTESMALVWNDLRWCLFVMVLVKLSLPGDRNAAEET